MDIFLKLKILTALLIFHSVVGKRYYLTPKGECSDCSFKGANYQWCTLGTTGWQYCSTLPGHTSRNWKCQADHQCNRYGYSYMWCYTDNGSWDYCSHIDDSSVTQYTYTSEECQNYCAVDPSSKNYVCRKVNGDMEHCSIVKGITSNGQECGHIDGNEESFCKRHGSQYLQCRVSSSSDWKNCSVPYTEESILQSVFTSQVSQVRSCDGFELVQVITGQSANDRRLVTTFFRETPDPLVMRKATRKEREDALLVVYNWLSNRPSDIEIEGVTIQRNGAINLNRQGSSDCAHCTNFQLKINVFVLFPDIVAQVVSVNNLSGYSNEEYNRVVATGLYYSLETSSKVWISQQLLDQYANPQCPSTPS